MVSLYLIQSSENNLEKDSPVRLYKEVRTVEEGRVPGVRQTCV